MGKLLAKLVGVPSALIAVVAAVQGGWSAIVQAVAVIKTDVHSVAGQLTVLMGVVAGIAAAFHTGHSSGEAAAEGAVVTPAAKS